MQTSTLSAHEMLARATAAEGAESAMPRRCWSLRIRDDEAIALGGRLRRFTGAHMVHVTDGAPQDGRDSRWHGFACVDDYRAARAEELRKALKTADLGDMSRECLGIPDQRAALQLVDLTHSTTQWIETHRPEIVFTHPYEGGHPDHDACSFAVHHARERCSQPVLVVESAFYHADPQEGTEAGVFLPGASADEMVYRLSPEEQKRKAAVLPDGTAHTCNHRIRRTHRPCAAVCLSRSASSDASNSLSGRRDFRLPRRHLCAALPNRARGSRVTGPERRSRMGQRMPDAVAAGFENPSSRCR